MNKIYRVASATLAMVLLLLTMGSCSKESQLAPDAQQQAGAGQLTFKLDNDALRSVPAEEFEKEVDPATVWCVFVTPTGSGAQTFKEVKQATKASTGEYIIKAGFEGDAQMFVIANVQDALKTKLEGLTTASTLADVQKLVVENALGDKTTAPDKFIMTSELINVTLPTVGGVPYKVAGAIKLKRLAARFDVISEVPGLTLTTISVANRVLSSTLLNVGETGSNVAATTDYEVDGGRQLLHKIYSYQNTIKGGTTGATSFTLKGKYGDVDINPIKVDLKNVADGKPLDVQRNYCYRIIIKPAGNDDKPIIPDPTNPTDPTAAWKVTIKVIDWNEAAADLANYSDEDLAILGTDLNNTVNPTGTNLLNAVAEYNIDYTGTKFTTSHTNASGYTGYFIWDEAKALQMPAGYHLPNRYEWTAILGSEWGDHTYVYFNRNETKKDVSLTVQIPGQTGTMVCKQDVKQVSAESATYMIRYKDKDTYRSAWRYSYVYGPIAGQKVLKIESVPVKATLTIEQLNKDYFANPKVRQYVKTIYLPTTGYNYSRDGSGPGNRGSFGEYWSASENSSGKAFNVYFGDTRADLLIYNNAYLIAVRPFRNL
ncbi:fimbrial protein [Porphyromonas uenonis]|uniref:fimbrial protein n=1 Tax=Porphyromonas uenonis TaxID=281920 RepID=UPI00288B7436|nr:fimbrial protein [Porphyromonas uenonis]